MGNFMQKKYLAAITNLAAPIVSVRILSLAINLVGMILISRLGESSACSRCINNSAFKYIIGHWNVSITFCRNIGRAYVWCKRV